MKRIYDFITEQATKYDGKLQIIVVDHAQLPDDSFVDNVIQSWWDGNQKLIPTNWIKN